MSDEKPEALLKSALEKIVYFEARASQLTNDAGSSREELERTKHELAAASQRVTSGLRFEKASEDPNAAASILTTQSSLRSIEQYKRNIDSAGSYTAAEEGALEQLTLVLDRARELANSTATASADEGARAAALTEVNQLYQQIYQEITGGA